VGTLDEPLKVVLDTGAVVSALVFPAGRVAWLRTAWQGGVIKPLVSRPIVAEIVRVLAYPKFQLGANEVRALLADYLPYALTVAVPRLWPKRVPRCRDPDDDPFLALASAGAAEVLVSGDPDLLALRARTPFAIETPAVFKRRLGPG
jgi:putative PIN family toxin of toxin-antitoxin system